MGEQFEMNLGVPEKAPDEFAGMSADALRENIALQETRLRGGIVDTADTEDIKDFIGRMKERLAQMAE